MFAIYRYVVYDRRRRKIEEYSRRNIPGGIHGTLVVSLNKTVIEDDVKMFISNDEELS